MSEFISINKQNKKYRPYSSNFIEKKLNDRLLSAGNINNSNNIPNKISIYKNYIILPTLNIKNSLNKINRKIISNSMPKQNNFKYEVEKLYDQNVSFKKKIRILQKEINAIKNNIFEKQNLLNEMNGEIEKILKDNKELSDISIIRPISSAEKGRYLMIGKMKNKIKEAESGLKNEIVMNKKYRHSLKFTKIKELEFEKKVIEEEKQKIISLIENSKDLKIKQKNEIQENKLYNKQIKIQNKLITDCNNQLQNLDDEEQKLENQIIIYKNNVNRTNNNIKIIKIRHISLKEQNSKLKEEQKKFNAENNDIDLDTNLQKLNKKLSRAKNEYTYQKNKNINILQKLEAIKKIYKIDERKKEKEDDDSENSNSKDSKDSKDNLNHYNYDEKINKLKIIYERNRKKEKELGDNLILYQEAVEKLNNGENINLEEIKNKIIKIIYQEDIVIGEKEKNKKDKKKNKGKLDISKDLLFSKDNPYYTYLEENDIIKCNKLNNSQFSQFTYILLKNFEAKKINYEKAKNGLIVPLMNYYNTILNENENQQNIQDKINLKFCEIIKNILNFNNQNDLVILKVYFNCIFYEKIKMNNSPNENEKFKIMTDYFLSLFNYIYEYNAEKEKIFKNKLKTKYKTEVIKLKNILDSKNKDKDNEFISFQDIKNIFDENKDIKLKEKYKEYIIYCMKQYDNNEKSLFDLKISKIDDILKEEIMSKVKENKINELNPEISLEEYNKNIDSVLVIIKQLMEDEKKDLKEIFGDSLMINYEQNKDKDIITIESFVNNLKNRNIKLSELQISCFNKKYCINEKMNGLDIKQIENDIINFNK